MPRDLILGTAGHIDHGKTSLVRALTGIDTDRLPEEKARGITIDIGFANLDLGEFRLGIVDVPGHERFIKNMLAGATGIDLALLVVAADDSVMPQTREHLEILRLLRLRRGVIALTKCDLAEPGWLDLVEGEIRELVRGTFLEGAPIVRTSAASGAGLDQLRAALAATCGCIPPQADADAPFRLAIDRSFAVQGHGTVVTGSVASGRLRVGDELDWLPAARRVRVRGLQNHDQPADEVHRGQRAAVNLTGVHYREVFRGHELATPGYLKPSRVMTVRLTALPGSPLRLRHRSRVRLHLGTAEIIASVSLLQTGELSPGGWTTAQLFLGEPAVAVWGQPFVLRAESPTVTVGGGQVLQAAAQRLRRRHHERIRRLDALWSDEPAARAAAAVWFYGFAEWTPLDLCRDAGLRPSDVPAVIERLAREGVLVEAPLGQRRRLQVASEHLDDLGRRVCLALAQLHEEHPLHAAVSRQRLVSRFDYLGDDSVVQMVIDGLLAAGGLKGDIRSVALAAHVPRLSPTERKLRDQILAAYRSAGFQPPEPAALQKQAASAAAAVPELIDLAVAEAELVHIGGEMYLHHAAEADLRRRVTERLANGAGLAVSEIKEMLGTSRKFAIPMCEYLDRIGLTRREGDLRHLASSEALAREAGD